MPSPTPSWHDSPAASRSAPRTSQGPGCLPAGGHARSSMIHIVIFGSAPASGSPGSSSHSRSSTTGPRARAMAATTPCRSSLTRRWSRRVYPFVRRGMLGDDTLTGQRVTGELTLSIGNRVLYKTGPTRGEGAATRFDLESRSWVMGSRVHALRRRRHSSGARGADRCQQPAQFRGAGLLL